MNYELYKDCISRHADVIEKIKLSAHKLHESVNQTYDKVLPYGYYLDMVVDAVHKYGHQVCANESDILPLFFGAYYHDSIEDARLTYNDVMRIASNFIEAEWEYAARGGNASKGYKFAGSNNPDNVAWHQGNSNNTTHNVKTKKANELGIYDMSGNVWEWCQDWYDENYYSKSPSTNPCNNTKASVRVNRGGGWGDYARSCRVAGRSGGAPDNTSNDLGLRLAF